MAGDIRKEIKFVADLTGFQDSMRQIGPMLKQLEEQLRINIPITPSVLDKSGQPWSSSGAMGGSQSSMAQMKQTPAYQLLQMQEALKTRTERLDMSVGGKTATQMMEERLATAKSGGKMTDITAMEKLLSGSKDLDTRFSALTKTIEEFDKKTKLLTEEELKQAVEAKKELSGIQKQRSELVSGTGMFGGGEGGVGEVMSTFMSAMVQRLGPAGILGGLMKMGDMGFEAPMSRAFARGTTGQRGMRNIMASTDLTSFENVQRMDPGMQATAEDAAQSTGTWRGLTKNWKTAAAIAAAAAIPFTGGLSAWAAGGLMAGAATTGVVANAGWNKYTGEVEKAQNQTFEERMQSEISAKGPEAARYRELLGVSGALGPMQKQFGMSLGYTRGLMNRDSGLLSKYGMGLEEYSQTVQGAGGVMSAGVNQGIVESSMRLQRGTGLSAGEVGAGFDAFSQVGGAGVQSSKNLEDVLARGVARGYNNSALARQYLQVMTSIAQQGGGGFGASNAGAIGAMMDTMQGTFGGEANAAQLSGAVSSMGAMASLTTAGGGIGAMASGGAADEAVRDLIAAGASPGTAMATAITIRSKSEQELSNGKNIEMLARTTFGSASKENIGKIKNMIQKFGSGRIERLRNIGGGLTGGNKEAGMAMLSSASGNSLGASVGVGLTAEGMAENFETGAVFTGGKGAAEGAQTITDKAEVIASLPAEMVKAASALNTLSTAFNPTTIKEMGERLLKMNEGLGKVNPEAEKMGLYFQAINIENEKRLRSYGINPEDVTTKTKGGAKGVVIPGRGGSGRGY